MVAFRSPKPLVRVRVFLLLQEIEVWCNGSTTDFGSVSLGSSPGTLTKQVGLGEWLIHQSAKLTTSVRIRYPTLNCPYGVVDAYSTTDALVRVRVLVGVQEILLYLMCYKYLNRQ